MGVTGLWTVVQPCARPIKIETLNRKRLAVDASIWIYAFLKAVRDKEGNALRNSHVVGFYRRICKLLYIGILPVFVFDGGAPSLKRQTINSRKQRREGRRDDAVRTAGKLLALQMQRRAEEEDQRRREAAARPAGRQEAEEEEVPDDPVYAEEAFMTQQEVQQKRKFKKTDQYHLPELDVSLAEMGQPNDPRVMSLEELEHYARQFDSGEDINIYDFSKIDFNSPFFQSLPPSDRYNILNAARLRSRLRMGLSKDQLDGMFPDRMAFSRFQIERVKERNELTQRLMHVNGMGDDLAFDLSGTGRVAGEKGREYVLVKNAGVEGGWALGVIGDKSEGGREKPINVDEITKRAAEEEMKTSEDEEEDFEDVPIEGLNRLPKAARKRDPSNRGDLEGDSERETTTRRNALYKSRRNEPPPPMLATPQVDDSDSLFLSGNTQIDDLENEDEDEAELQRAIAMSLENGGRVSPTTEDDRGETVQSNDHERSPMLRGDDAVKRFAHMAAPLSPTAIQSDEESEMEFENVLAGPHVSIQKQQESSNGQADPSSESPRKNQETSSNTQALKFDGPLPFEKLDLGSSILGKKKMKKIEENNAGGFEKDPYENKEPKKSAPLPPWFSADLKSGMNAQNNIEKEDREKDRLADRGTDHDGYIFQERTKLQPKITSEVIDLEKLDEKRQGIVDVVSSGDEAEVDMTERISVREAMAPNGDIPDLHEAKSPIESNLLEEAKGNEKSSPGPPIGEEEPEEELYEWEESDVDERAPPSQKYTEATAPYSPPSLAKKSPSMDFEDVDVSDTRDEPHAAASVSAPHSPTNDIEEVEESMGPAVPLLDESDDERYGSEEEDEELMLQMATETEEHARFVSTLNSRTPRQNIEEFERELKSLQSQQKKDRRDADEVTHVMITECQQLLKLFGLPYITAPMEAEAQCAELVSLGLVDGIVTDDSDIFLFGGTRIYKNMFNQSKFVECYLSSDLEREFDLTREKMIRIAHLLGSDYTEGLPGVGPVTALEIISEFPEGLQSFKDWWTRVQTAAEPTEEDTASAFRRKFRRNSTKLFLPPVFPDMRVDEAYQHPEVDSDPSSFQWGVPDLDALRSFLMATVGWSQERTDEVLVPVIRDMNRRETDGTQANITRYVGGGTGVGATAFAPRRNDAGKSKRMERALEKLAERARVRRKAGPAGAAKGKGGVDLALKQDRAVVADEVIIEIPGSAVADGSPSWRKGATGKAKRGAKRKAAATKTNHDGSESEDVEYSEAKSNGKKVKRRKGKKTK